MSVVEIINVSTQGGAVVLLILLVRGLYTIAREMVPAAKDFLAALVAHLARFDTKVAVIETKVDGLGVAVGKAGTDAAAAIGRVGDSVQAEASELRTEVQRAERSIVAVVRREQASDPPPSRTSVTVVSARPRAAVVP